VQSDADAQLFESQLPTIVTLTKGGKSAKVIRDTSELPDGCGSTVVTATIAVHTLVKVSLVQRGFRTFRDVDILMKGLVDLDVEISKCDKKLDLAKLNLSKVLKVESQADYQATVPENVRLANEEKVRLNEPWRACVLTVILQRNTLNAEIATLEQSKAMFEKLK
jgi:valyl-tRNA synthetase